MSIIKYLLIVVAAQIFGHYWMEILIVFVVVVAGVLIKAYLNDKKKKKERMEQEKSDSAEQTHNQPDTLGLMFSTLCNIGCQPTKNDDGSISVSYQGEKFHVEFNGMFARVWDLMWAVIKADDTDLPNLREAVNSANIDFGPTVVLSAPDEEGFIGLYSRYDIMLHPGCPDNELYVKSVLDSFFKTKELVHDHFQQIKAAQPTAREPRRPVGFTTAPDSNE